MVLAPEDSHLVISAPPKTLSGHGPPGLGFETCEEPLPRTPRYYRALLFLLHLHTFYLLFFAPTYFLLTFLFKPLLPTPSHEDPSQRFKDPLDSSHMKRDVSRWLWIPFQLTPQSSSHFGKVSNPSRFAPQNDHFGPP